MSETRWYVRSSDQQYGPYSATQLKQLAQQGRISASTEVRREQDATWVTAARINGLLDGQQQVAAPPTAYADVRDESGPTPKWIWVAAVALVLIGLGVVFVVSSRNSAQQRRIDNANQSVAKAVQDARAAIASGDFDKAEALLREAMANNDATDKSAVKAMLPEISKARTTAQAKTLLTTAQRHIQQRDVRAAIKSLQEITNLNAAPADIRTAAAKLLTDAELATSSQDAKNALMQLSDSQFTAFLSSGELPSSVRLEPPALNEMLQQLCRRIGTEVDQARKQEVIRRAATARAEARQRNVGHEFFRFEGHVDTDGVSISPNRAYIASPDSDANTIHVWNMETGKEIAALIPPEGRALDLRPSSAFSMDSEYLAVAIEKVKDDIISAPRIGLWDFKNRRFLRYFAGVDDRAGGKDFFGSIALSNGHLLATTTFRESGREQHGVRVWELRTGKLVRSFQNHKEQINAIAVSPNGQFAVTGGDDRIAILWEIETGREIKLFDDHESSIKAIAISPDGEMLLTGGFDCSVRYWDVRTGRVKQKWQLGLYHSGDEAQWRLANAQARLRLLTTGGIGSVNLWKYPFVTSADFAPSGDRAIVGLRVLVPQSLHSRSNPVILDLVTNDIVELPSSFAPRPMSSVWAAFNRDGSAAVSNRVRSERVRGEEKTIPYLSVTGVP